MMTFEQFKATRRAVDNLDKAGIGADDLNESGLIYADSVFIISQGERYVLLIGNTESVSDDLEALERSLYRYWLSEAVTRKDKLGAIYVSLIGYNPFADDATLSESQVAETLADYVRDHADFETIAAMVKPDDLDTAIGNVQEFLGVTDGGFAAIHFDTLTEWETLALDRRTALAREYMAQEILHYLD